LRALGAAVVGAAVRGPARRRRSAHPLRDGQPRAARTARVRRLRGRERRLARAARRPLGRDRRSRHTGQPRSRGMPRALVRRGGTRPRPAAARARARRSRVQPRTRRAPGHRRGRARAARRAREGNDFGDRRMTVGVVLMTYGAPSDEDDLPRYLSSVRGGRAADDALLAEMRRRYAAIGGSPLVRITIAQAAALERTLGAGWLATAGMRFSQPTIADAVSEVV